MKATRPVMFAAAICAAFVTPLIAADDTAKEAEGGTKFKAKPKWSEAKPMEVKAGVSASTGDQKVTLNPQIGADLGVAYVGVGAKVDVSTLPPDPKDKWVNPASLGGVKVEVTPETKVAIRAGNVEVSATKTAPDKKVTGEVKFNGRENKAHWGDEMKGAVQVVEDDDRAFAAPAEKKPAKSEYSTPEKHKLTPDQRMAELASTEAELKKVSSEMVKDKSPTIQAAPTPVAPAEKLSSGYAIYKRPADISNDDWQALAKSFPSFGGAAGDVQVTGNEVRIRVTNLNDAGWNEMSSLLGEGWVIQRDR